MVKQADQFFNDETETNKQQSTQHFVAGLDNAVVRLAEIKEDDNKKKLQQLMRQNQVKEEIEQEEAGIELTIEKQLLREEKEVEEKRDELFHPKLNTSVEEAAGENPNYKQGLNEAEIGPDADTDQMYGMTEADRKLFHENNRVAPVLKPE